MGIKSQGYGGQRAKDLVRDPESACIEGQGRMKLTSGKREMEWRCKKVLKRFFRSLASIMSLGMLTVHASSPLTTASFTLWWAFDSWVAMNRVPM